MATCHANSKEHSRPAHKRISVVVPVLNEASSIIPFLSRLMPILDHDIDNDYGFFEFEILFVDDGSSDGTVEAVLEARANDSRIKLVSLSRNFGKDIALAAGIDHASGNAVILIDVDLQDPPEIIPEMVRRWLEGCEMVYGVRVDRNSDSFVKRLTARGFYHLYNIMARPPIPANAGDFRLLDGKIVAALRRLPERHRFMKGLYSWVGFKQSGISFTREARSTGTSKWRYWALWNFALDGITASTTMPLRIWSYIGVAIAGLAFVYAGFLITRVWLYGTDVPGYASLMTTMLFFGGLNLITLGVLGEYVGRIFSEVKGRPLYILRDKIGFETTTQASSQAEEESWTKVSTSR